VRPRGACIFRFSFQTATPSTAQERGPLPPFARGRMQMRSASSLRRAKRRSNPVRPRRNFVRSICCTAALDCFATLAMTNQRKAKEAERRQTQVRLSAPAGAGRATEVPACADPPLRARSPVGVPLTVLPWRLSLPRCDFRPCFLGRGVSADPVVVPLPGQHRRSCCGRYPPSPVPVQRAPRGPVRSAGRLMPETARVRIVTPPAGTALAPAPRSTSRRRPS